MRDLTKWMLVFISGMLVYRLFHSPKVESAPNPEPQVKAAPEVTTAREPASVAPVSRLRAEIVTPIKPEKNHALQKPKEVLSLTLTESIIEQMEQDWNELPVQAEARREVRGWRFTRVDSDSSFYRAGFREGDLVTTEFMDSLKNSDVQLVTRMEQIFNRITR